MARKQKRRTRDRRRPPAPASPPLTSAATRTAGPVTGTGAVEMRLAPPSPSRRRAGRVVLEGVDPAIPLDQVPHFASDLRRIGITIAVMVILLILGSRLIPLAIR